MGSLDMALAAIRSTVNATLEAANLVSEPDQVFVGWPTGQELHDVMHQPGAGSQVSIWPFDDPKPCPRYHPTKELISTNAPGVQASLDSTKQILTFSGTPKTGDLVHAFFGKPLVDANYTVIAGDTPASIAASILAKANTEMPAGVHITISGAALTVTGAFWQRCNIGQVDAATYSREINRMSQTVQVNVWSPNAQERSDIAKVIETNLGGTNQPFLMMADGTGLRFKYAGPKWRDQAQQAYSAYRAILLFQIEYGITQIINTTSVEAIEGTITADGSAPITVITGGP